MDFIKIDESKKIIEYGEIIANKEGAYGLEKIIIENGIPEYLKNDDIFAQKYIDGKFIKE